MAHASIRITYGATHRTGSLRQKRFHFTGALATAYAGLTHCLPLQGIKHLFWLFRQVTH